MKITTQISEIEIIFFYNIGNNCKKLYFTVNFHYIFVLMIQISYNHYLKVILITWSV